MSDLCVEFRNYKLLNKVKGILATPDLLPFLKLMLSHHDEPHLSHSLNLGIAGRSVRVCARCSGMAVGYGCFIAFVAVFGYPGLFLRNLILLAILPVPAFADWGSQVLGVRKSSNTIRVMTGFPLGLAQASFIYLFRTSQLALETILIASSLYILAFFVILWRGEPEALTI